MYIYIYIYDGNPQDLPFQQISCYSNTVLNILNSKRVRPCVWSNFRRLAQLLLCPGDVFDAKSDTFGSNLENLLWISCGYPVDVDRVEINSPFYLRQPQLKTLAEWISCPPRSPPDATAMSGPACCLICLVWPIWALALFALPQRLQEFCI